MSETCDVLVVGAGLAGLQCARELAAGGRDVQVWEAADEVGGRIRTDEVDGYLVDRGFQVLNPAYPAVRRWVDVPALRLQSFGAGVGVRRDHGLSVLAHPLRQPGRIRSTLFSGVLRPHDLAGLARWAAPALAHPERRDHARDVRLSASLDAVRLSPELRRVVEQFLAGVLLEDDGATSYDFALLLLRMFALGAPGLPTDGMRALPRQLAADLGDRVRTGHRVESISRDGGASVVRAAGQSIRARQVVVATDPAAAGDLTDVAAPRMKGVLTHWFATERAPSTVPMLHVDARSRPGPLVNAAVVSVAAPSYAPPGRHLVQTSALFGAGRAVPTDDDVRRQAGELFGSPTTGWELVARHEVPRALPVQPPPLRLCGTLEASPGVLVCGDHRDTASIQGALVSGHRAARAALTR